MPPPRPSSPRAPRPRGRFIRRATRFLFWVTLLALVLAIIFPERVAQKAALYALRRHGQPQASLDVASLGLNRLVLKKVSLDDFPGRPRIAQVDVRYSPRGLLQCRVESVHVKGLRATVDPSALRATGSRGGVPNWSLGSLHLEDAQVGVTVPGADFEAHLSADIGFAGSGWTGTLHASIPAWSVDADLEGSLDPASLPACELTYRLTADNLASLEPVLNVLAAKEPRWKDLRLSGQFTAAGELTRLQLPIEGTARLTLQEASVASSRAFWAVSGLESEINLTSLWPMQTASSQSMSFASAKIGGLDGSGEVRFSVDSKGLAVESVIVEWCNGTILADPFRLDFAEPSLDVGIRLDGLDLGCAFALQTAVTGEAEGKLDGVARLRYRPGDRPEVTGRFSMPAGTGGRLRLQDASLLTRQLEGTDARLKEVARALQDFTCKVLLLEVTAGKGPDVSAHFRLEGRSSLHPASPPINLGVTFEIDSADLREIAEFFHKSVP